jgi:hypothetical protein
MSDDKQLSVVEQRDVNFYDDQIIAVRVEDGTVYVPIRPICDLIGVNRQGQQERINRDPILSDACRTLTIVDGYGSVTPPQGRAMLCLPLDYLNGWLFGINANRVKDNVRESVLRYQRECYRVLFDAFQSGELSIDSNDIDDIAKIDPEAVEALRIAESVVKLARSHVRLLQQVQTHETRLDAIEAELGHDDRFITVSQAEQISQGVRAIALVFSRNTGRNEYGGVYGELYRQFSINTYKRLPAGKFDEAMNFLRQWWEGLTDDLNVPF